MKQILSTVVSLVLLGNSSPLMAHRHGDTSNTVHNSWQKRSAIHFLSQFDLSGDETVLDLGTGDGKVSAYLSIKIPEGTVMGVDKCSECIQEASKTYNNHSFPNLNFTTADATELPFDQEFDLVTSLSTLHLVQNKAAAFRGIKRSMKADGRAILLCPLTHALSDTLTRLTEKPKWKKFFQGFDAGWQHSTPKQYQGLLADVELEARHFHISRLDETYESEEEFKDGISRWIPHLTAIPSEKQGEFMEELIELYAEESPFDSDGRIHFYVDRLEIEAHHIALEPKWEDIAEESQSDPQQVE